MFGIYYADGRDGDFTREVFPYVNTYIACPRGCTDTSLDWRPLLAQSLQRAVNAGKDIYLMMGQESDWDEVLSIATPHWSRVKAIEVWHEVELDVPTTDRMVTTLRAKLLDRELESKPMGVMQELSQTYDINRKPFANGWMSDMLDFVGFEAYLPVPGVASERWMQDRLPRPTTYDPAVAVSNLNYLIDRAKAQIPANKRIVIAQMAYSRNFAWTGMESLIAVQNSTYLKAYNDPRVMALLPFAYGRKSGAISHPELKYAMLSIGAAVTGAAAPPPPPPATRPAPSTVMRSGPTYALSTAPVGNIRGLDADYDKANKVFLLVHGNFPVGGVFLDDGGAQVGSGFSIPTDLTGWAAMPRVACSGEGSCLVTWHDYRTMQVKLMARLVRFTAGGVPQFGGSDFVISVGQTNQESPADLAYSPDAREYLVTWGAAGYKGTYFQRISDSGGLLGSNVRIDDPAWETEISNVAYNPVDQSFNVITRLWSDSSGSVGVGFRKIKAGTGAFMIPFRLLDQGLKGTKVTDIEYDSVQQKVLASWFYDGGGIGWKATYLDLNGNPVAAPKRIFSPYSGYDGFDLAFNSSTQSFLGAFHSLDSYENVAAELFPNLTEGAPTEITATGARIGSFLPRVVAHPEKPFWLVMTSKDYAQVMVQKVVKSGTIVTPSPTTTTTMPSANSCNIPDPFVFFGGGYCVNGGWLPPGHPGIPANPPPATTTTTTPQPATTTTTGAPGVTSTTVPPVTPTTTTTTVPPTHSHVCLTVKPGPDWVCVGGGWLPPGHPGIPSH